MFKPFEIVFDKYLISLNEIELFKNIIPFDGNIIFLFFKNFINFNLLELFFFSKKSL